jgi:hypothetical protein
MTVRFPSRVDGKFQLVAWVMPCVALLSLATTMRSAGGGAFWIPTLITVAVSVLLLWVVLGTYYEFERTDLVARSGPFSWRVPLNSISSVHASNSAHSGPALSMDRLEIVFAGSQVLLISPADKTAFLSTLYKRAPQLAPRRA